MNARRIRKIVKSRATIEGAGVHLHRAIGLGLPEEYDPFLLLDISGRIDPASIARGFRGIPTAGWRPSRTSFVGRWTTRTASETAA